MTSASVYTRIWVTIGFFLLLGTAGAQRLPGDNPTSLRRPGPPPNLYNTDSAFQPIFISGRVQLAGAGAPGQPVAIERVCSGAVRLLGFTDSKGQFQFPLASNPGFQDASENDMRSGRAAGPRATTTSQSRRPFDLAGCDLRAVLPGFQSSSVMVRMDGDSWQFDAGTIVLKRLEGVPGTTISLTTLSAPQDALRAYEKAQRVISQNKLDEAEKELEKAVQLYPQFADAWTLLGDLHSQAGRWNQARMQYGRALAADPQFLNPYFKLALLAVQEKNWEEAVKWTDQVARMNSSAYPSAYFYNAAANFNLRRFEAAEGSARKFKALDAEHSHPDVSLLLSLVLERRLDYAGAAQQIRDYLAAVPNAPNAEELREKAKRYENLSVAEQIRNRQ